MVISMNRESSLWARALQCRPAIDPAIVWPHSAHWTTLVWYTDALQRAHAGIQSALSNTKCRQKV